MYLIKFVLDGLGIAAGVALGSFFLIFNVSHLKTGSSQTMILGLICCLVFLIVALIVFYFSNKQHQKDQKVLMQNLLDKKNTAHDTMLMYLTEVIRYYESSIQKRNLEQFINDQFISLSVSTEGVVSPIYIKIKNEKKFISKIKVLQINKKIKLMKYFFSCWKGLIPPGSDSKISLKEGFFGFVCAFGATAGGINGMISLLATMDLIPLLTKSPSIGWSLLIIALLCGIVVAIINIYHQFNLGNYEKKIKKYEIITTIFTSALLALSKLQHKKNTDQFKSPKLNLV